MVLDLNHGATRARAGVPTREQLDTAAATLESAPRDYLGGSRLGEECARRLQYEYEGAARSRPLDAKTHIVFGLGHAGEDLVAELLRAAGFDLRTHKNGRQFGFETAGGRIRGHIDGVICGGPAELGPYPYLWENKWVAAKYWQAIVKNGVRAERPVYAGQIATYQAYLELTENPALFSFGNRDTGEIAFERVPFDAKLAQECTDRGVLVIKASEARDRLPRPYANADFYKCRLCDFAGVCWSGSE